MDYLGKADIKNCIYPYALSYTINFAPKDCSFSSTSHFWSLAVEEHFYIFWPLLFAFGKRTAILAACALAIACVYFGTNLYPSTGSYYFNRWTFPAMLPILAGCLLAFCCDCRPIKQMFTNPDTSKVLLLAILAGLATPAFTKGEVLWLLSVVLLILYIYHNQQSTVVRILEFKPLAILGVISYGLYVWQGIFTGNGPYRTGHAFPPPLEIGVWMTFIAAPVSYVFFERPIIQFKKRYSWRNKIATPAPQDISGTVAQSK